MTALRLIRVLDVLFSTPARPNLRAPCPRGPLRPLASRPVEICRLSLTCLLVAMAIACAHTTARPVAAPDRDDLARFLETSPAALAVAEAAATEGLLSSSESDIEDLEVAAGALGIETVGELAERLEPLVGDASTLFAALEQRRRGSRTGDVAHWVAVTLLALDPTRPQEEYFRGHVDWQPDYADDVFDLRRINDEGGLLELAIVDVERAPLPHNFAIVPEVDPEQRPRIASRRDLSFLPVFASPGTMTMGGTVPVQRGRELEWDELRVLVRTPGDVRVLAPPEQPLERLLLSDDGEMTPAGTIELAADQHLALLLQLPGQEALALSEPGYVVRVPWEANCCQLNRQADADWWVRLASGDFAGAWVLVSSDTFRISYPALERRWQEEREAREVLRLGPLRRGGTLDLPGARIVYWLTGTADAPPLFVLHGGPGIGSRYMRAAIDRALGWNRLLLFYDQRGSGYSEGADVPGDLTLDRLVVDLDAVRDAAGLERIDLMGHSFGGLLALSYALKYPGRVDRLVLVDPDPASRALWETFHDRVEARTAPEDAAKLAEITARPGWESDPGAMEEWFETRTRAYMADPADVAKLDLYFDEMSVANYAVTYPAVRESLGDWAIHAESIFAPQAMEALHAALPNSRLEIISGAGQFTFVEAAQEFLTLVAEFLER